MHIADLKVHSVYLDRIYHTQVAPAGGQPKGKGSSHYLLLEIIAHNGTRGIGEVSDLEPQWAAPTPESLRQQLADALLGGDPLARRPLWEQARANLPADLHPELRNLVSSAVDMALLDLAGKIWQVPAHVLLGGAQRQHLPISWVAYIRGTDLLATEISGKVEVGFSAFKLKVGADPAQDDERVRLLRRLAGPRAYIKLDASGQWQEEEAVERISQLAEAGADAIETPIQAVSRTIAKDHPEQVNRDPVAAAAALARVRQKSPLPIIEHVADFDDNFALALLHLKAVDIFNVVPAQAGSIHRAHRLLQLAETGGVDALLGSTVELGPGTAAALHLGLATKAVNLASDLVGPGLLTGDVATPRLAYTKGHLAATPRPGLGVDLSDDLLRQYGSSD